MLGSSREQSSCIASLCASSKLPSQFLLGLDLRTINLSSYDTVSSHEGAYVIDIVKVKTPKSSPPSSLLSILFDCSLGEGKMMNLNFNMIDVIASLNKFKRVGSFNAFAEIFQQMAVYFSHCRENLQGFGTLAIALIFNNSENNSVKSSGVIFVVKLRSESEVKQLHRGQCKRSNAAEQLPKKDCKFICHYRCRALIRLDCRGPRYKNEQDEGNEQSIEKDTNVL
ncbi:Ras association domain-containing protein 1, partial [Ophiophagus hannah]